jgi:hypothetical protein
MTSYAVNRDAVKQVRAMIDKGRYDTDTPWGDAAPSADEQNAFLDAHGWEDYAAWHLGVDTDSSPETKGRFHFPYGDFTKVNRAALIHGKQRASQNDHDDLAKAFDELLKHLDDAAG